MTYEIFKDTLYSELSAYFPPDTTISYHSVPKNNHVILDALTILESGFNIAPTIYIQQYYEKLKEGTSFSDVFKQILDTYHQYRPMENIDTSFFSDFEHVKSNIVYKLIHYEQNKELLSNIPHIPFLDLAIVFYYLVATTDCGTATILIQNPHLQFWNTDTETLYALAKENTPSLLSPCFEKLTNILSEMMDEFPPEKEELFSLPMYVLTNKNRFLGAGCILYDNLLANWANKLSCDFYIIPSSIHEVLVIPADDSMTKEYFGEMIQEVNTTQLSPEEVLSDHVYFYDRNQNQIFA